MRKRLNIKRLLRDNPKVDRGLLAESQRLADKLHKLGQTGPFLRMASPFERKRATIISTTHMQLG